ncbi:MAG: STAS/SEC14 domain-containing protein [Pseudonocardia sp.]
MDVIERLTGLPAGIDGLRAEGRITRGDYQRAVAPLLDEAIRDDRRIRALMEFDSFGGITPAGMWTDLRLGVRAFRHWAGYALLTDLRWVRETTRLAAFFVPFPVRVFDRAERAAAVVWLQSLPRADLQPDLDPASGVVVAEADSPLGAPDIEALESAVDTWLTQHAELRGLVLHAPAVPGWRNVTGLARHLKFVRDHHRHIRRVAVAIDGPVAELAPKLAGRLLHPQVRHFRYDELDRAHSWAAGGD